MLRDEAVELIQDRLGNRKGLEPQIGRELRQAQRRLESRPVLPWFLEKVDTSLVTVADTESVAVPTDFIDLHPNGVFVTDTDGSVHRLDRDEYMTLYTKNVNESHDLPKCFALVGTNIHLFPIPDQAYSLVFWEYAFDTVLDDNVENNWLKYYPEFVIADAGYTYARRIRDDNAVKFFQDQYTIEQANFIANETAREEANRQRRSRR